jgi:hypothetical protein
MIGSLKLLGLLLVVTATSHLVKCGCSNWDTCLNELVAYASPSERSPSNSSVMISAGCNPFGVSNCTVRCSIYKIILPKNACLVLTDAPQNE